MNHDFYCDNVLTGRIAVDVVMETERVLAFHHTKPHWPVHIVVIPKQHVANLLDLVDGDPDLVLEMMRVVRAVVAQVLEQQGGCRLTTNFGSCQETKHLHWHVYIGEMMH